MKSKKQYRKPQLTEVRLVIQSPVLANCESVEPTTSQGQCIYVGAPCADIT